MAVDNTILVRRGSGTPDYTDFNQYELAYDYTNDKLYIRDGNAMVEVGSSSGGATGDIDSVTAGTGLDGGGSSGDVTLSVDVSDFMSNGSNNRILTATGTDAMNAEANLTFDGSILAVTGEINFTSELNFTGAGNKIIDVETLAGSNSLTIRHHNPSGNLFEDALKLTANAGAKLYYNNGLRFETTNTGATLTGGTLDLPNTGDWSYILNNTNSGGLRFGSKDSGGTLAYQIEISNTGNYVKLNENTSVTGYSGATEHFQLNFTGTTNCLLKIVNSGWTNATTHDILYNYWSSNIGDYTYLKSAGNSTSGHGIALVGDTLFAVGDTDVETGAVTNSATAPFTDTWFYVNGSGNGWFKNDLTVGGTAYIDGSGDQMVRFTRSGADIVSIEQDSSQLYFYNRTTSKVMFLMSETGSAKLGYNSNPTLELRNTATSAGSGPSLTFGHSQGGNTSVGRIATYLTDGSQASRAGHMRFYTTRSGTEELAMQLTNTKTLTLYQAGDQSDYMDLTVNDTHTEMHLGSGNYLKLSTDHGYLLLGPQNSSHCHYTTDRSNHWFNTRVVIEGGVLDSYNEDLNLRRASSDADRIEIAADYSRILVNGTERFRATTSGATITGHAYATSSYLAPDGSAATPAYRFNNDGNTGMYLEGTDTIGFSTNGSGRYTMNATGTLYVSDKVQAGGNGIEIWDGTHGFKQVLGKDSTYTFLRNNDSSVCIHMGDSGDQANYYNNGQHIFRSNTDSEYMRITSTTLNLGSGDFSIKKTGGNNTNNYPAVEVFSAGTAENQAAIAIQQQTSEGDTIIFADFEPHVEWGISADNSADEIHFTGGTSTGSLGTKTFKNNAGANRTAYKKMSVGLSNGNVSIGNNLTAGSINTTGDSQFGNRIAMDGTSPFLRIQESGVTNNPEWWIGGDGGNFSIRLNNSGAYPLAFNTNAANNAIDSFSMGYGGTISGNLTVANGSQYFGDSTSGVWSTGNWAGDLTSNGYERVCGVAHDGGEVVIVEKNAQSSILVDGDYFAYENNGFWSSNNSTYGNATGFKSNGAAMMMVCQKDGGSASLQSTGDLIVNSGYISGVGNDNLYLRRTTNNDDRITIEASAHRFTVDATDRMVLTSSGLNVTNGVTTGYGVSFTNGNTNFLQYNNATENVLYMRDTTNGAMLQTWGVNTVTMNKNTSIQGNLDVSGNSFLQYGLVVNEGSHDADFRVESNSNAHMIQADAGNSRVGINNSSPYESLDAKSLSSTSPAIVANGAAANGCLNMAHGYAGANGDYVNTYGSQYSSIATVIGYGVKPSTNVMDQFLCSADNANFTRGALVIDNELRFWQGVAATGTLNNAMTMTERFRLNASGDGHFDGDVVAYSSTVSDKRLKENITTIDNALNKVMALRGVEYDWTATSRKGTHDIGLVAQEVEEVIPELVTEHELCTGEFGGEGNEKTFKTVNYDKMVGVLIEAIKEQQVQINELKTKIGEQNG